MNSSITGTKALLLGLVVGLVFFGGCIDIRDLTKVETYKALLHKQTYQDYFKTNQDRVLAPEKVIAARKIHGRPINPILPSLSPVDTAQEIYPNAEYPTEQDYRYSDQDYVIGASDVLGIGIMDLFIEGQEYFAQPTVSESGYIRLPQLHQRLKAEGLTAAELEEAIADVYRPDILLDPTVTVTVIARTQSLFSIIGAVERPSNYSIIKPDMTLIDALAMAGGVIQREIKYVYVVRQRPPSRLSGEVGPATATPGELPVLPELPALPPEAEPAASEPAAAAEPAQPAVPVERSDDQLRELERIMRGGKPELTPIAPESEQIPTESDMVFITELDSNSASLANSEGPKYKWQYVDGRWVPVPLEAPTTAPATVPAVVPVPEPVLPAEPAAEQIVPAAPPRPQIVKPESTLRRGPGLEARAPERAAPTPDDPFGWCELDKSSLTRIIAVNYELLKQGNERMNVVIRDDDKIIVPYLEVGLYYVMGEVGQPGAYGLTGRRVTVKQAMTEAGNLGPLAWPQNAMLVRRIDDYQEQMIPLDLEAIFKGEENDFYLKPDDLICVGTDARSIFYAVLRNAFRMTYGFGFIYDRNFSQGLYYGKPNSERFTRW